jgi:hypothetical protein
MLKATNKMIEDRLRMLGLITEGYNPTKDVYQKAYKLGPLEVPYFTQRFKDPEPDFIALFDWRKPGEKNKDRCVERRKSSKDGGGRYRVQVAGLKSRRFYTLREAYQAIEALRYGGYIRYIDTGLVRHQPNRWLHDENFRATAKELVKVGFIPTVIITNLDTGAATYRTGMVSAADVTGRVRPRTADLSKDAVAL